MAKSKKPAGLVKAEKEISENKSDFDLVSFMSANAEGYWDVETTYNNIWDDPRYHAFNTAAHLASAIAKEYSGYDHSSDLLDNASNFEYKQAAGVSSKKKSESKANPSTEDSSDDSDSSDDMEEDDSILENRHDYYEDVKSYFKQMIDDALGQGSLSEHEEFHTLYDLAKKQKYKGSKEEFESLLKGSPAFREFCKRLTTNFTG